jgi:hypothetical protein
MGIYNYYFNVCNVIRYRSRWINRKLLNEQSKRKVLRRLPIMVAASEISRISRFDSFIRKNIEITVFCNVTRYFLSKYQRFREIYFPCIQDIKQCRDYFSASKKKAEFLPKIWCLSTKLQETWYVIPFCFVRYE